MRGGRSRRSRSGAGTIASGEGSATNGAMATWQAAAGAAITHAVAPQCMPQSLQGAAPRVGGGTQSIARVASPWLGAEVAAWSAQGWPINVVTRTTSACPWPQQSPLARNAAAPASCSGIAARSSSATIRCAREEMYDLAMGKRRPSRPPKAHRHLRRLDFPGQPPRNHCLTCRKDRGRACGVFPTGCGDSGRAKTCGQSPQQRRGHSPGGLRCRCELEPR